MAAIMLGIALMAIGTFAPDGPTAMMMVGTMIVGVGIGIKIRADSEKNS